MPHQRRGAAGRRHRLADRTLAVAPAARPVARPLPDRRRLRAARRPSRTSRRSSAALPKLGFRGVNAPFRTRRRRWRWCGGGPRRDGSARSTPSSSIRTGRLIGSSTDGLASSNLRELVLTGGRMAVRPSCWAPAAPPGDRRGAAGGRRSRGSPGQSHPRPGGLARRRTRRSGQCLAVDGAGGSAGRRGFARQRHDARDARTAAARPRPGAAAHRRRSLRHRLRAAADAVAGRGKGRGNPTASGIGMLLHQARPGFAAWFGRMPEILPDLRGRLLGDEAST